MTSYGLKDRILEIEIGLSGIDREKDYAVYEDLLTKLYFLLISNEGIRYFQPIYDKKGAKKAQVAKEPEDYLSGIDGILPSIKALILNDNILLRYA